MIYDVLQEKREKILKIASEHGIQSVRVFGSVAKYEDGPTSDLDLLVDFDEGRSVKWSYSTMTKDKLYLT
ncbi:nucleotidyltransferase family protein [Bacillus sp. Marseille-P3661]|uniref:nucleotidyltransferase family protein n=1 Tax=Bacillus sp. Marseille-P3661 TaxID=1936234 RepID=UPI0015E1A5E1|nr:nucleotidyltransferase domain-containing protein [Bacillus sp. Marseille-P3661]